MGMVDLASHFFVIMTSHHSLSGLEICAYANFGPPAGGTEYLGGLPPALAQDLFSDVCS